MRRIRTLVLAGALVLMSGCGDLLSLHALYTKQDRVVDTAIEGRWENKDDVLMVERVDDHYVVTLQSKLDPAESTKYELHFADLQGVRLADLLPDDGIGHMFLRVRVTKEQLRIAFFDSEWLRRQVPHQDADLSNKRKQAVLTVETPRLRDLVAKYANEPKAYDQETTFQRQ